MSSEAFEVPPLSRRQIRLFADSVRSSLRITTPFFPIVPVIEFALPSVIEGFFHDVVDVDEMNVQFGQGCHAMTFPDDRAMFIREDIYERARGDKGRDRLTLAHEVGHLLLHCGIRFAKRVKTRETPAFRDSEWQANAFGGELLVSYRYISRCKNPSEVAELFKVSEAAAEKQWEVFKRENLIK